MVGWSRSASRGSSSRRRAIPVSRQPRRTRVEIEDAVAGGPGFVAVGTEAEFASGKLDFVDQVFSGFEGPASGLRGAIWASEDGLAWRRLPDEQLPDSGEGNVRLFSVTTGGPGLVAVGWRRLARDLIPVVWTSTGGETWSLTAELEATRGTSGERLGGQIMTDVVAGGPGLVAVGADGSFENITTAAWTSP